MSLAASGRGQNLVCEEGGGGCCFVFWLLCRVKSPGRLICGRNVKAKEGGS